MKGKILNLILLIQKMITIILFYILIHTCIHPFLPIIFYYTFLVFIGIIISMIIYFICIILTGIILLIRQPIRHIISVMDIMAMLLYIVI